MTGSDPTGRVDAEGAVRDAVVPCPLASVFGAAVIARLRAYKDVDRESTPHNYFDIFTLVNGLLYTHYPQCSATTS